MKVPKENLVGQLNGGWDDRQAPAAVRAPEHLRAASAAAAARGAACDLGEIAKNYVGVDDDGGLADADLRGRITTHMMDARPSR